jgi:hypothetical protein
LLSLIPRYLPTVPYYPLLPLILLSSSYSPLLLIILRYPLSLSVVFCYFPLLSAFLRRLPLLFAISRRLSLSLLISYYSSSSSAALCRPSSSFALSRRFPSLSAVLRYFSLSFVVFRYSPLSSARLYRSLSPRYSPSLSSAFRSFSLFPVTFRYLHLSLLTSRRLSLSHILPRYRVYVSHPQLLMICHCFSYLPPLFTPSSSAVSSAYNLCFRAPLPSSFLPTISACVLSFRSSLRLRRPPLSSSFTILSVYDTCSSAFLLPSSLIHLTYPLSICPRPS